jgi:radical SAM protein with 4Fe4S-binding SPASM domain
VQINTNGTEVGDAMCRDLLDAGLDGIIYSIDGATPRTYESIRVGASYEKVVRNVLTMIRLRGDRRLKRPIVKVQFVKMKQNQHEVPLFVQQWKGLADDVVISTYSDRGAGREPSPDDLIPVGRARCSQPWQRLVVSADGLVTMCCGDWDRRNVVGDVNEQSIAEIWQGGLLTEYRRLIHAGRMDDIDACRDCFVLDTYRWAPAPQPRPGEPVVTS